MNILVVIGDYIQSNSSANLCHLAYLRGLIDAGHDVTLISSDGRDYQGDQSMIIPDGIKSITFYGTTLYEKCSIIKKKRRELASQETNLVNQEESHRKTKNLLKKIKQAARNLLYGKYGTYIKFVRKARNFKSEITYDFVISIAMPASSHLLAHKLLHSKNVRCNHWIQIWEDPWYADIYGFSNRKRILKEEKRLLSLAEKVYYVSPLTLHNQQRLFPESAKKMDWQPVPTYYRGNSVFPDNDINRYGYFGDYVPSVRNLKPFYNAALKTGITVCICGDPCSLFNETDRIRILPRIDLEELKPIEDNTNVLVFLCNRQGGQIPGKIYQYSATNKIILFILDGTQEEKSEIEMYFSQYSRYVFCDNSEEEIIRAINCIENGEMDCISREPIEDFNPRVIISKILEG